MTNYIVGDNLILMCMLDTTSVNTTGRIVMYSWQCTNCFADGVMNMSVTRVLTDMDSSTISCMYNVGSDMFTATTPFELQVTEGNH